MAYKPVLPPVADARELGPIHFAAGSAFSPDNQSWFGLITDAGWAFSAAAKSAAVKVCPISPVRGPISTLIWLSVPPTVPFPLLIVNVAALTVNPGSNTSVNTLIGFHTFI